MMTKTCSKCGETKDAAEFNKNSSATDGLQHQCRVCNAEYRKTPKAKAVMAEYHAEYRKTDKCKAAEAAYAQSDKGKAATAAYQKTDRGRFANSKSSAKRRGIEFLITFEEYVALITESERCYYCDRTNKECYDLTEFVRNYEGNNARVLKIKIAMDNKTHRSSHFTIDRCDSNEGYTANNCVCACSLCNVAKGWMISARDFRFLAPGMMTDLTEVCTAAGFNYTEEADHGDR